MKKHFNFRDCGISIVAVSLLLLLTLSCETKIKLFPQLKLSYEITYSDKKITIKSTNTSVPSDFFLKDGEYYAQSDSVLFFSTKRDTVIYYKDKTTGLKYRTDIEKCKNNEFKTSSYFVGYGRQLFMIAYIYDSNYKILRVERMAYIKFE